MFNNISTLLIITIIIILSRVVYELSYINHKSADWWKRKNKSRHEHIIELTSRVTKALDDIGIVYWAHGGTIIGQHRHSGIIPWDDDVDLAIMFETESQRSSLRELLKSRQMTLWDAAIGVKVTADYLPPGTEAVIDLFVMHVEDDNKIVGTSESQIKYPADWYYLQDVFPLKLMKFDSLILPTPHNSEPYLIRNYSSDWKTKYAVYYHFEKNPVRKAALNINKFWYLTNNG